MKIFIFEDINKVSNRYHEEGGLVIVANNKSHAKEMIEKEKYVEVTEKEWEDVIEYDIIGNHEPKLITFPDAGCC